MWNDLTISQKSDLMQLFLRNGISNIDEMQRRYDEASSSVNAYSNQYALGNQMNTKKPKVTPSNKQRWLQLYNDAWNGTLYAGDDWRNLWRGIVATETGGSFDPNVRNGVTGASGWFQIMPKYRTYTDERSQFSNAKTIMDSNIAFFNRRLTAKDRQLMQQKGLTMHDLYAGAWIGGAQGMLDYLRTGKSAKDANGTSIGDYINLVRKYRGASTIAPAPTVSSSSYEATAPPPQQIEPYEVIVNDFSELPESATQFFNQYPQQTPLPPEPKNLQDERRVFEEQWKLEHPDKPDYSKLLSLLGDTSVLKPQPLQTVQDILPDFKLFTKYLQQPNQFATGGPQTKYVNGRKLTLGNVPATGEARWVDLDDIKDFDGIIGYGYYGDDGNRQGYTQWQNINEYNDVPDSIPLDEITVIGHYPESPQLDQTGTPVMDLATRQRLADQVEMQMMKEQNSPVDWDRMMMRQARGLDAPYGAIHQEPTTWDKDFRSGYEKLAQEPGVADDIDKVMFGTLAVPIAVAAGVEAAPYLGSLFTSAADAVAATGAGQTAIEAAANPYVQAAVASLFGADALHHMTGPEGTQKTARLGQEFWADPSFYNGVNYAKSIAGDVLDASMLLPVIGAPIRGASAVFDEAKGLYNDLWDNAALMGNEYATARQINKELQQGINGTRFFVSEPFNQRYVTTPWTDKNTGAREFHLYNDKGELIGENEIEPINLDNNRYGINWIGNVAEENGAESVHGVSEDLYNTAVEHIQQEGGEGLISGHYLLSPEKTERVTAKFPHIVLKEKPNSKHGKEVRLLTGTTDRQKPLFADEYFIRRHFKNKKKGWPTQDNEARSGVMHDILDLGYWYPESGVASFPRTEVFNPFDISIEFPRSRYFNRDWYSPYNQGMEAAAGWENLQDADSISLSKSKSMFGNLLSRLFNKTYTAPTIFDEAIPILSEDELIRQGIDSVQLPEDVLKVYNSRKPYSSNNWNYQEPVAATKEYNNKLVDEELQLLKQQNPNASEKEIEDLFLKAHGVSTRDVRDAQGFVWRDKNGNIKAASYDPVENKFVSNFTKTHEDNHTGFWFNEKDSNSIKDLIKVGNDYYLGQKQGFKPDIEGIKNGDDTAIYINADEVSSYMSELSTFFGNKGSQKLTPKQLEFAKNNRSLILNKMGGTANYYIGYILDRVTNPKLFCEWLKDHSTAIIPVVGAGTAYGLSQGNNSNVQAYGGPLMQMANRFDDGGEISKILDANTGEIGNILGVNSDGTYSVQYSNGVSPMTLQLPEVSVIGNIKNVNPQITYDEVFKKQLPDNYTDEDVDDLIRQYGYNPRFLSTQYGLRGMREQGLQSVYPEFALLAGGRGLTNGAFGATNELLANPYIGGPATTLMALDAERRLLGENGIKKTVKWFQKGDKERAYLSLFGDVLDASMMYPAFDFASRFAYNAPLYRLPINAYNNMKFVRSGEAAKAFNDVKQYSQEYMNKYLNATSDEVASAYSPLFNRYYGNIDYQLSLNPFKYGNWKAEGLNGISKYVTTTGYNQNGLVRINPFSLFKNPEDFKTLLGHEFRHTFEGIGIPSLSMWKEGPYYVPNVDNPLYNEALRPFENAANQGLWRGSPNELGADVWGLKYANGDLGTPFWLMDSEKQLDYVRKVSTKFGIPEDQMLDIMTTLSKGHYFDQGGYLNNSTNKFAEGGQPEWSIDLPEVTVTGHRRQRLPIEYVEQLINDFNTPPLPVQEQQSISPEAMMNLIEMSKLVNSINNNTYQVGTDYQGITVPYMNSASRYYQELKDSIGDVGLQVAKSLAPMASANNVRRSYKR